MKASEHTEAMLAGWKVANVDRADLAVRRPCGAMLWQRNRVLEGLPLAWAKAENAHGAEIYIRPARGFDWPMVFLDDLPVSVAQQMAWDHGAMVVQTSFAGGCHAWIPCALALDEAARHRVQRWLARKMGADFGSVSGEHLGRLAGFKNWKRGGCWVNVLAFPTDPSHIPANLSLDLCQRMRWQGELSPESLKPAQPTPEEPLLGKFLERPMNPATGDASPSGREWGWVCRMLETGRDPEWITLNLVARAWSRRGQDAERYARRTVEKAMEKVGRSLL